MVAVLDFAIFSSALATSLAVIAMMVMPQWRRIALMATGHTEQAFMPLATLAVAEQRIAVRRWAARPLPASISRLREAA